MTSSSFRSLNYFCLLLPILAIAACAQLGDSAPQTIPNGPDGAESPTLDPQLVGTPLPTRPAYDPGELVEYTAQNGDTLPALAAHFNTSVDKIMAANPIIPENVTTLPTGFPMQIPIYYRPFWGSPYQIIPDSQFVNGPALLGFNTQAFVDQYPGWLKDYSEYASGQTRSGAGVVDYVAANFSISPRLLLALLEYQAGALSSPILAANKVKYPLGHENNLSQGVYLQLVWAANTLNNGYYGWRTGNLVEFDHPDGRVEQPDPWQNAASVALQYYFSQSIPPNQYLPAIGPLGIAQTFSSLFGDPWPEDQPHIPGSLNQPAFQLPFEPGQSWAFTGGPHTGWGSGEPFAALDFAPPSVIGGCKQSDLWATAQAPGLVVRSERGIVVLDLDTDGDDRTGWVLFYLHLESRGRAQVGDRLEKGARVGHPSCEGGSASGTHVHIARKYNGEWIPAAGALPFTMEGWTVQAGDGPYEGSLTRLGNSAVVACECSVQESQIISEVEVTVSQTPTP
ncbi:MAG: LysM peptidoglycan-binding domain-containing protein [Anaerolineae bacterium]|nr:LysM peptidoglycan-binding domain-containing protein [Anaerolineae bacterium]